MKKKIKNWLVDNDLKQCDFAKMSGISDSHLSLILQGITVPSYKTIESIVKATRYEISPNDIFEYEEKKENFLNEK